MINWKLSFLLEITFSKIADKVRNAHKTTVCNNFEVPRFNLFEVPAISEKWPISSEKNPQNNLVSF